MIVERNIQDRYTILGMTTAVTATSTSQLLLTASYPTRLRVRKYQECFINGGTGFSVVASALVVVHNGGTIPSIAATPTVAGSADYIDPQDSVIYSNLNINSDFNATGGGPEAVNSPPWFGDNKIIELKVGDLIYYLARQDNATASNCYFMLDLDVLQ